MTTVSKSNYKIHRSTDFPSLRNDLILQAAAGKKTVRAPTWIMRQAGRYLPEFRKLRESHSFFEICQTPELACEITMQPILRYEGLLDASIIFSDILVVPQAMGLEVQMLPAKGPHFPAPLDTPDDIKRLHEHIDIDKELGYVFEAISLTRKTLDGRVPLIGFAGAPWTLFAYMVEGGGSKTFSKAKKWLFDYPEASLDVLNRTTDVIVKYLVGQVRAGAQLLQVFDSWASELSHYHYEQFSLPFLRKISKEVRQECEEQGLESVPLIVFAKGVTHTVLPLLEDSGYNVIGLDWTTSPLNLSENVNAVQGNFDPNILYANDQAIDEQVKVVVEEFKKRKTPGWISNLGHGITPGVKPESLRVFLEAVQKYTKD
ncbi:uroporphyrinogen decarboxylase [Wallemia mellicola]|nr:uroporphyrinogen decarboxylase [Wallemia mellicola]TIC41231.1 uroporphyrinogen decarboxylase [Wallemia mellicola]